MTPQPLSNARVGDTVTLKGEVSFIYSTGAIEVIVPAIGDRGFTITVRGHILAEDVTPAPVKYKLGTVLIDKDGMGARYVVVDEEGHRAARVYGHDLVPAGTIYNISDLDRPVVVRV